MLNIPVPYTAPATPQSFKYNYSPSSDVSAQSSRRTSQDRPRPSFSETDHYYRLDQPLKSAPPVIVFFSFLGFRSKQWALDHQVADTLRGSLPQGTSVVRYHLQGSDAFSQTLTQAWSVAEGLQVDDKIIGPMFQAVHSKRVIDLEGVREVFDGVGVPPEMLAKEFMTQKTLIGKKRMTDAVEESGLEMKDVPAICVQGQYFVKLDAYGEFDMQRVVEMVKALLEKVSNETKLEV